MPTITFADFAGGIDLSRPASMQSANRFRTLTNAFVTPGKTVRKRPGTRYRWSWGAGIKGLFPSVYGLSGFAGIGNPQLEPVTAVPFTQSASPLVPAHMQRSTDPTDPFNRAERVRASFRFAGGTYIVAETAGGLRHFFHNGTAGNNAVVDANCPHGGHAIALGSKIFAVSPSGVVRFSATNSATDWTTPNDAGFLPTNNQSMTGAAPIALGEFLGDLAVFYPDHTQLWTVGPDPSKHAFKQRLPIGTQRSDAHASVGQDLFFAAPMGVRSIALNSQFGNAMDVDVGTHVDKLAAPLAAQAGAMGRYFPALGQYWLIHGAQALVYSFSRTAKVYAWSQYRFPWTIQGAAEYGGRVYLRSSSGDIYMLDDAYPVDDDADAAVVATGVARNPQQWVTQGIPAGGRRNIDVTLQTPYLDFKSPAATKSVHGFDVVSARTAGAVAPSAYLPSGYTLDCLYRSDSGGELVAAGPIDLTAMPDDTRPFGWQPLGLLTATMAVRLRHAAPEDFEFSALAFHFDTLGVV